MLFHVRRGYSGKQSAPPDSWEVSFPYPWPMLSSVIHPIHTYIHSYMLLCHCYLIQLGAVVLIIEEIGQ